MSDENPATLLRELLRAWNAHDPEAVAACFAPVYEGRTVTSAHPLRGPTDAGRHCRALLRAFPDLHLACQKTLVDGDELAAFWQMSGTHRGLFLNIPPTDRAVRIEGVIWLAVHDGLIHGGQVLWDVAALLRVLGLLPHLREGQPD